MNKRQWKKQGTKLRHNGHYASYVALFLGFKKYLPIKLLATFLLAIFVMEFVTGLLDMAIWGTVLVAVKRIYQIRAYKLKHENNIKS